MQPDEQSTSKNRRRRFRAVNLDLFYYERSGSRYDLRITPFALILMLAAAIIGFSIIYFDGRKQTAPDVRIVTPPATPYPTQKTAIRQVPPPPPPTVVRQRSVTQPSPPALPPSLRNSNER
jgi:hypothetical protein